MKDFMVIAIGIVVVFALYVSSKSASRRMGRIEKKRPRRVCAQSPVRGSVSVRLPEPIGGTP